MTPEPEEGGAAQRELSGAWLTGATALGVALSVVHLWVAFSPVLSELQRNVLHFAGFALLTALWSPGREAWRDGRGRWIDLCLGALVALATLHVALGESAIYARGVRLGALDWAAGAVVVLGAMEYARRVSGISIPIIMALSLAYVAGLGAFVPGVLSFPGLGAETVMFRTLYGDDAMFGSIASISSTTVFLFVIFGAFLLRCGAGDFVIAVARAAAGRMVGGPGLVAVIASGLTGTISGSAVANVASTGVITIPLMKSAGFSPRFAGAVEAAASTGGPLMPPIMGAGAFLMASYTLIPYERIVAVAALPAILYFASVAFFVRIEARRRGMVPQPAEPGALGAAMRAGGLPFFLPVGVVIGMLLWGYTPSYAAVFGIVACVASSWTGASPMGPRGVVEALALGARNMISTAVLLVAVGVFVNVIATAGVGNAFSLMVQDWSQGNLLVALLLVALAAVVLGLGLPVTAAYVVLATLSAPAIAGMMADAAVLDLLVAGTLPPGAAPVLMLAGADAAALAAGPADPQAAAAIMAALPLEVRAPLRDLALTPAALATGLLSAHMIIFWLSQDSNVTPPVALASATAAAIAKGPPLGTAMTGWKLAKGLYIMPVLFAYTPFLSGDPLDALRVFAFALVGVYAICAAMEGWMENRLSPPLRAAAALAGVAAMWPWSPAANVAGVLATVALLAVNLRRSA